MTRRQNQLLAVQNPQHYAIAKRQASVALVDAIAAYLEWHTLHGSSSYTVKHERENLQAARNYLGEFVLDQLAPADIEVRFIGFMRAKGLSGNTINLRLKTLKRFYKFSLQQKWIAVDPVASVAKVRSVSTEIPSLTMEQLTCLLSQPNRTTFTGERDYTFMCLAVDTGLRLREMLDLTVAQIDIKNRVIKGVVGKNQKRETITLTRAMCEQLQVYLDVRGAHVATDHLFVSLEGRPLHRKTIQDRIKAYGTKAKITDVRVSPHTLRHTFAKQWILGGGDVFSLQRMLRHSTMDQVKQYVYLWGREIQVQHDKFSPLAKLQSSQKDRNSGV